MFNIPTVTVAKTTLDSTSDSVTLTYAAPAGVSWTPRHLLVRTNVLATTGTPNFRIRLNGDSGSNYNIQVLDAAGSSSSSLRETADHFGLPTNVTSDANEFCSGSFLFPDALSTRSHKSVLAMSGRVEDFLRAGAGRWANTAAITSVTLYLDASTFAAGSTFELCVVDETFNIDQDGDGEQILGSAGTITVGSIGAADGDLVVIGNLRGSNSSDDDAIQIDLNGDSTDSNYGRQHLQGASTTVSAGSNSDNGFGLVSADTATASAFGAFVGQIINYSDGSNDRAMISLSGSHNDSGSSGIRVYSTRWNNTAAVTSVKLSGISTANFITGSMLSTYAVPKNLIGRQELSGTATSVTFSDIPQTYDHVELSVYARGDRSATQDTVKVEFNGDTTAANYDQQVLLGSDSGVTAAQSAASPSGIIVSANTAGANIFGSATVTIYNYTKTDRHKHWLGVSQIGTNDVRITSQRWENTAAITSIVLDPANGTNFLAGSVFTLRGISADITPAAAGYTIFF